MKPRYGNAVAQASSHGATEAIIGIGPATSKTAGDGKMPNKQILAAFMAATIIAAGGTAWATVQSTSTSADGQTKAEKDFSQLSADGTRAYNDLTLTRLAIYNGKIDDAKKLVGEADTAFGKSKADDSVFMKAEQELKTPEQMGAKSANQPAGMTSGDSMTSKDSMASKDATSTEAAKTPIAWLPVDGAITLDENYSLNPAKKKAVADANQSLSQGDRKGALDKLKLADVDMSVALQVVPLTATINDVHQAASMINSGQYYEGSQMLRKVQMAARYDVTDIVAVPNTKAAGNGSTAMSSADTAKSSTVH